MSFIGGILYYIADGLTRRVISSSEEKAAILKEVHFIDVVDLNSFTSRQT